MIVPLRLDFVWKADDADGSGPGSVLRKGPKAHPKPKGCKLSVLFQGIWEVMCATRYPEDSVYRINSIEGPKKTSSGGMIPICIADIGLFVGTNAGGSVIPGARCITETLPLSGNI